MTKTDTQQLAGLLLAMEAQARAANNLAELGFSIANESYGLLGFRQAVVLRGADRRARVLTVSGLVKPSEDSPYLVWLRRAWSWVYDQVAQAPGWFAPQERQAAMPEDIEEGWREWWTAGVYVLPLRSRDDRPLGWVLFLLDAAPAAWQEEALKRLAQTWGYCWEMLSGKPCRSSMHRWRTWSWPLRLLLMAVIGLLMFLPVRQTALAPAEIVSLDARVVAAPIDGVIKSIHVRPNQAVNTGDPLFSLDDTTLRNRLEVARKSVAVADAELIAATQKAFHDSSSQSELALLSGRAHERRAELAAVQAQLSRVQVNAEYDGIAVFADPDDWLGRPVSTGERIMLLANPGNPGMLISLPAADAIALEPGAQVKLFLSVRPLDPLAGKVSETSYQAMLSPDGISSYRLRALFDGQDAGEARIGLRGTAKLYGERVALGYYLFRRPLATLREWTGW